MRNLKRALSLALASVMVLGLMIVGSSAAGKDFTDYGEIEYKEAVDVMTAIDVIDGMDDGSSFNPDGILNREQAAKIIATMVLGKDNADKLSKDDKVFSDVAPGSWAAGYISYCHSMGYLSGDGAGHFLPAQQLTGVAFGKLLLCALGYDAIVEGYQNNANWETNIASDMVSAGIAVKGVSFSAPLTREQATQMAFQTLTADMVYYQSKGVSITQPDGTIVAVGATPAASKPIDGEAAADNYDKNATNRTDGLGYQQFCEVYFDTLKKDATNSSGNEVDDFARPGYTWLKSNSEITFANKTPVASFTGETKAADLAKALAGYKLQKASDTDTYPINNTTKYDSTGTTPVVMGFNTEGIIVLNGNTAGKTAVSMAKSTAATIAETLAEQTKNGRLVEFYANSDNVITDIVEIEYTVAEVKTVTTKNGQTTYAFDTASGVASGTDYESEAEEDTIVIDGTIAKGDIVTAVKPTDGPLYVYPTTKVTGAQTAKTGDGKITVDGTQYTLGTGVKVSSSSSYVDPAKFNNSDDEANYFVDQYGFVVKTTSTAKSTDYALILNVYGKADTDLDGTTPKVQVRALLADGTVGTYDVELYKLKSADVGTSGEYKSGGKFGADSSNEAKGTHPSGEVAFAADQYVVKNTGIVVYDKDDATDVDKAAKAGLLTPDTGHTNYTANRVFSYTLKDNTLTLDVIKAGDGSMEAGEVYSVTPGPSNKTTTFKTTGYTEGGATALVNQETTFITYNSDKKTSTIYSGVSDLPSTDVAADAVVAIMTANTEARGTASIVFLTKGSEIGAGDTDEIIYIDASEYSQTGNGSDAKYTYTGTKADGTTVEVTADSDSKPTNDGLYTYNEKMELDGTAKATRNDTTGTAQYQAGQFTVEDGMLIINKNNYRITDDTQIVDIDGNLGDPDGNYGYVVLEWDNGATGNVASIFIVSDSALTT